RLRLPKLSNRQGLVQGETSSGTAAETHMDLDHLAVNQGDIFDEQAENAFSFSRFDGRIIPHSWKVGGQGKQLLPRLGVNQQALLLRLLLIVFLRFGQRT